MFNRRQKEKRINPSVSPLSPSVPGGADLSLYTASLSSLPTSAPPASSSPTPPNGLPFHPSLAGLVGVLQGRGGGGGPHPLD